MMDLPGGWQHDAPACQGTGTPTVVFDSGTGNDGTVWGVVVSDISKVTRACAYDRMGLGYSSYGTKRTRTSQQMADELYGLLQAARLPGPYVLVAHSGGAWNQRLFAASHAREVAAMARRCGDGRTLRTLHVFIPATGAGRDQESYA